ncbi:MAG: TolC family protein, partial [Longimicrobiales bacterium]
ITMERFSHARTTTVRATQMTLLRSATVVALISPAMLAGQSVTRDSINRATATIDEGAPAPTLSLAVVFNELRKANPRVQAAEALARAARARIPAAGLPPDPELQFGWMDYELPSLKPMEVLGMKQLQVMQMLPLGGKLGLSKGIARSRASAQFERARDAWWEVRAQTAMPFFEIYRTDQSLSVMRETLRLLGNIRDVATAMYRVGNGNQTDVLRAQVEIARMTEDTLRMQAMRIGMAARLNAMLDRPQKVLVSSPALPAFPQTIPGLDSLELLAYFARPMLRAGSADLRAAQSMEKLAKKELLPDLQLGIQYAQRGNAGGTDGMPGVAGGTERMGSLMIGASVPVFAKSRQLRMRDEAAAMRQMAESELQSMRADTRSALGERYADLIRSRRLAALYRNTIIPQARTAVSSALASYRVGKVDFMALLDNQMTVNKYRQEVFTLEAEEGRAWIELEMLTGTDLMDTFSNQTSTPAGDVR